MNTPKNDPKQIEFDFPHIHVEPALQAQVADYTPTRRRVLAAKFERWAHQLRTTADMLERRAFGRAMERPRIRRLAVTKLVTN